MYRTPSGNNEFRRISEDATITKIRIPHGNSDLFSGIRQHPPWLCARHDKIYSKRTIENLHIIQKKYPPEMPSVNF